MNRSLNKRRLTGTFGIMSFLSFLLGFAILYWYFETETLHATNYFFSVGFNIPGMKGLEWAQYFNYFFVGFLIIAFSISLLKNVNNVGLNKIGKILILISGIIYSSFGFMEIEDSSNLIFVIYVAQIILTLGLGAIGFILLSDDYLKIQNNKILKYIILVIGILIIINGILEVLAMQIYPSYMGMFSWLLYFLGIGVIGLSLIIKPAHNNG
ncbi:hypothetical protein [Zunongwangia sp. HRR-M8]|uniref:hypothetical protein n=1 Tax=Zunongwangia sp. HRR-M8 TaxID=3015170 RepID=UPI0022DD9D4A|nr:hypothetical protein [Zunongwangia sp. HRR-M8]WBL23721.1 hypothetical protein PBT89_07115 [Zunongwangia sp. HRR-M8]